MKNVTLKERGITLIALVITIIILLILAGVTLRIVLSENGLFEMSKNGVGAYKEAGVKESTEMDKVTNEMANIIESLGGKKNDGIAASEIAKDFKKYCGAYVNYEVDLNGDKDYTNDWKLFYIGGADKDDSKEVKEMIYLIAADYVPMENETLKAAMGDKDNGARMFPATESGYEALSAYWGSSAPAYQPLDGLS